MKTLILTGALVALLAVGCDKKEEPTTSTANPQASVATTSATSFEGVAEEDFEVQAEKDITAANLESELAKIEKEIAE